MSAEGDQAEAIERAERCLAAFHAGARVGDPALIGQAISHITCALHEQFGRTANRVLGNGRCVEDAEDAVSKLYLKLYDEFSAGRIPPSGYLRAWLLRVLINDCINMLRERKARRAEGKPAEDMECMDNLAFTRWNEGLASDDPLYLVVKEDTDTRLVAVVQQYFDKLRSEGKVWRIEVIELRSTGLMPAAIGAMLNSDERYTDLHSGPFQVTEIYRGLENYVRMIRGALGEENEE